MASDYITLTEFKTTRETIGFSFEDYDAIAAITSASRGIDEYTGRFFYSGTQTRIYEWCGSQCVPIDDFTSVSTVQVDYDRDGTYETTWTQGTSFLVTPFNASYEDKPYEELELLPVAGYHRPYPYPALVRVVGTFGWPSVPSPVKTATSILASRLLRRAREAPFGIVGIGADFSAVRIQRADPDVSFLLDPYIKGDRALAA